MSIAEIAFGAIYFLVLGALALAVLYVLVRFVRWAWHHPSARR